MGQGGGGSAEINPGWGVDSKPMSTSRGRPLQATWSRPVAMLGGGRLWHDLGGYALTAHGHFPQRRSKPRR